MAGNPIDAFVVQARAYVDFIERVSGLPLSERLAFARLRLVELYAAALALPPLPDTNEVDAGPSPPVPQGWRGFEQHEPYWEVFDPYEQTNMVAAALSDDVLDVYLDVHRGLALWDAEHREAAIWEWRFHFDIHWGDHAVDALRALHRACNPTR